MLPGGRELASELWARDLPHHYSLNLTKELQVLAESFQIQEPGSERLGQLPCWKMAEKTGPLDFQVLSFLICFFSFLKNFILYWGIAN